MRSVLPRIAPKNPGPPRGVLLVALAFAAGLALAPAPLRAQSSGSLEERLEDQKAKLKKIEDEIKQHRAKSGELKKKETGVVKQLSLLDKEIALSTKYLSGLAKKEALLVQQIDSLRVNIAGESEMLTRQKARLAERLRQMYMRGPERQWVFVMGGENMAEKLRRYKFMRLVAEQDARLVREVDERKQGLEVEQAGVAEALSEIAALKRVREAENDRLKKNKASRQAMLTQIRKDDAKHKQAIADLEKSQERMKDVIGELERKRASAKEPKGLPPGGFAGLKGKLSRPVDGDVIGTFGKSRHPRFGTVTFNNGIDIQARAGAPIRAVAAGRVEFVDWIEGYGNCIIVNHGGGYYTLYAHASEIMVRTGDNVSAGAVIAEVGDSGSLNGYACHFEIRKAKEPLNPMEWFTR
jgi:septal ring factor EnvC (AmiA/AmiB activator)